MTKSVFRFGIAGLVVSLLSVSALSASAQNYTNARQVFKDICFRSLLGINDEVLSDSGRFPCDKDWIPAIELGERFGDFTNAVMTVRKNGDTGKLTLSDVKFVKELGIETDDKALLREYEHAVELVGNLLGAKVECSGLVDPNANARRMSGGSMDGRIRSRTIVNLAKGQMVEIRATEASYVIRSGQPIQTAAPVVEIRFSYNPYGSVRPEGDGTDAVKELTLGADCSDLLSLKMRILKEKEKLQELQQTRFKEGFKERLERLRVASQSTKAKESIKSDISVAETNNPVMAEKISVAEKLGTCEFLLNKDFKKNAKYYLCLFSASWCPPCRREMPRIAKTYAETLKDDPDIELIHFSRDQNDEKALAWAREHDVRFPVVKPNGGNPLNLRCNGIPHLFILKSDGTIVEHDHPMRIFNEEKFKELKGGAAKVSGRSKSVGERKDGTEEANGVKWNYKIIDGEAVLKGSYCSGGKLAVSETTSGALVIPEKLGGFPVGRIDEAAFRYCTKLTSVTIPSTVTSIKGNPFSGCREIESFIVVPDNPNFKSVNGLLCTRDGKKVIAGVKGDLEIPEGVDTIGESAFYAYWSLKSVKIPASVKTIGPLAFYNSGLTSVVIPNGVVTIGNSAFGDCWQLTSAEIPASVTDIGVRAFSASSGKMERIVVSPENLKYASVNGLLCSKDGKTIIAGIDGDVAIPDGVTCINDCAFYKCDGLITLSIPSSVTKIGKSAFEWCDKVKMFSVSSANSKYSSPNGLLCTKDGKILLAGVNGEVVIPDGVTTISELAFSSRNELTSVAIPSSVRIVGEEAFRCCRGLTSVKMLGERPTASARVFDYCGKLKEIHVPANAKSWAGMKEWQGIPLVFD